MRVNWLGLIISEDVEKIFRVDQQRWLTFLSAKSKTRAVIGTYKFLEWNDD